MSKLAKLLSLPEMADRLASARRGKDSILAHINPTEARLLKSRGGSGKRNPSTGIVEFDDYDEDPNAGEEEAKANMAPPPTSYAPAAQDPAQKQQAAAAETPAPAPASEPSQGAYLPSAPAETPEQSQRGAFLPNTYSGVVAAPTAATSSVAPSSPAPVAPAAPQRSPAQGGTSIIDSLTGGAKSLTGLLSAAAPLAKLGVGAVSAVQGQEAAKQAAAQADKNAAEIKALSDPYRKQAAQLQQQGQQLMELGQGGGITSAQQKQLEIQRAQAAQQMASSGVTGGTAQQQLEANLQQQTAAFAQQNVNQGMKLVQDAMGINQTADKYIQDAITTGYSQNKDAQSLAADFYKSIAQFLTPDANTNPTSAAPGQAKVGAIP